MKTITDALRNWITTVIGIILIAVAIWFVRTGDMPWYGIIPVGIFSAWLIYAKDADVKKAFKKININGKDNK